VFKDKEVVALISDLLVPEDRRVLYAILFLTGVRFGETAALRWSDYDDECQPLGKLHVSASYSTRHKQVKSTKTGVVREVPVHPLLAAILADWRDQGWPRLTGREVEPDELIVPSRGQGKREPGHRSVNHMLKKFRGDCGKLKIPERRQHDSRRTLISLARAGGANADALKVLTHVAGHHRRLHDVSLVALPLCGAPQEDEPACGLTPIVALAQNHQVVRTLVIRDRSGQVAPLDVSPGGRQRGAGA